MINGHLGTFENLSRNDRTSNKVKLRNGLAEKLLNRSRDSFRAFVYNKFSLT